MAIARELVGIPTATMAALPINLAGLSTHLSWTALLSPQLCFLLFFTKLPEQGPDRTNHRLLQLLLHCLDDLFALLSFQFPWQKLYTHRADCSLL